MSRRRKKGTAWLTAKSAIAAAVRTHLGDEADVEVGWVKKIGEGRHSPRVSRERLQALLRRIEK